mmetsp:Transcript_62663/g.149525  ORF Transcript_62663/g.149525 Transcript_62663/m.149525 type:complete len:427 (-) Transcript_62663:256-1536(-)|eukprot:CAMPEP_0181453574 /NCGR_PEP_ID=MMETSP1110-20121109/29796_1 /TAXON_ID=174948 /ORGANISM="Symbiodinium sp., Strain CCMP421" /LENGTH=426 /DNA_ID=CAMNT_0023577899 /DNA_START=32 /DNA_END=1312 /DNA_ORIENTATION=+
MALTFAAPLELTRAAKAPPVRGQKPAQRKCGAIESFPGTAALVGVAAGVACSRGRRTPAVRKAVAAVAAASRPTLDEWMVKPLESGELSSKSRPAHWVIRTTDVKANLRFFTQIFGMKVLRHEEFDKPCAITCNGEFPTPWSKTMIGYGPEDENYCLELTYNYGIDEYERGTGLEHIAVAVEKPEESLKTAISMGWPVEGDVITGPDSYKFRVVQLEDAQQERFQYVALRVGDLKKAARFYRDACGMTDFKDAPAHPLFANAKVVGYKGRVPLVLFTDKDKPVIQQWEGRHAIAVPGPFLRAIYKRVIERRHGGHILHHLREFNELPALRRMRGLPPMPCSPPPEAHLRKLRETPLTPPEDLKEGTLAVAIVTDPDGYEICLVSSETYDQAVRTAYSPDAKIDWHWRGEAMAGRRTATPDFMAACI